MSKCTSKGHKTIDEEKPRNITLIEKYPTYNNKPSTTMSSINQQITTTSTRDQPNFTINKNSTGKIYHNLDLY